MCAVAVYIYVLEVEKNKRWIVCVTLFLLLVLQCPGQSLSAQGTVNQVIETSNRSLNGQFLS